MQARCLLLRRPPVLQVVDEPFLPPRARLDEVDERWAEICRRKPASFDGVAYHVLGVHRNGYGGAVLHVTPSSYRFHAVQDRDFDCGMRGLGVRGITRHGGMVLLGRRSERVVRWPGCWEFAPAGGMEPGADPGAMILQELREETGIAESGAVPTPVAILFDPTERSWEITYRIELSGAAELVRGAEHSDLAWFEPARLPAGRSPITDQMVELL